MIKKEYSSNNFQKNNLNKEDNYLISQYYNVVIENKWNFIKAG